MRKSTLLDFISSKAVQWFINHGEPDLQHNTVSFTMQLIAHLYNAMLMLGWYVVWPHIT